MTAIPITSPEEQSVTFVELFFDLVFVFSVTQVVGLFHDGIQWAIVGQALLVFWLVWWAWTQFTWALNAANTQHPGVQFGTLVATAIVFIMAVSLPQAFELQSAWFGVAYVLVRIIGLSLHLWVASQTPSLRAGARIFALVSTGGLGAVLVGAFLGGPVQYWLWGLAIIFDLLAAGIGGGFDGWNLQTEHFAERHGLFVIIALGETLIVAASGVPGSLGFDQGLVVAILVVATTCALWWSYFPRIKPLLDQAFASTDGPNQARLARDTYSLTHFLMMCGVVAFAVSVEEAILHPEEPLPLVGRMALSIGLLLFVGGMAGAAWRASGTKLLSRIALILVTGVAIVIVNGVGVAITLGLAFSGLLLIVLVEQRSVPSVGGSILEES